MQHSVHLPQINRSLMVPILALLLGAAIATATFALINIESEPSTSSTATSQPATQSSSAVQRYDNGPNEGAAQLNVVPQSVPATAAGVRYDGGPDEGTRGAVTQQTSSASPSDSGIRYDGGPDEGTRGVSGAGG
jgi:hypothetical protein